MPLFDRADVMARQVSRESLRVNSSIAINGEARPRAEYPEFNYLRWDGNWTDGTLAELDTTVAICPYCAVATQSAQQRQEAVDRWPLSYQGIFRQDFCLRCRFWRHTELRSTAYFAADLIVDTHHLAVLTSRARDFDPNAPEGTLDEIAQWFRRHPHLYQSVTPRYLEQLVARVFAGLHSYVDVIHVGRPGDDGIDVVLVEGDGRNWLVQVKRRETPTASEGVGTIRHLLGSMLLYGSRFGAVVSSADHYTYRAHKATATAGDKGYTIHLYDRHAFDRLLGQSLPAAPWSTIADLAAKDRLRWTQAGGQEYQVGDGLIGPAPDIAPSNWPVPDWGSGPNG